MSVERSVIFKRQAGLGDLLVSMCNAWHLANLTKRELLIDWRYSFYAPKGQEQRNIYFDLFEYPDAKSFEEARDGIFFPTVWNPQTIQKHYYELNKNYNVHVQRYEGEGDIIRGIAELNSDLPVNHIVMTKFSNVIPFPLMAKLARQVRLKPHIEEKIKKERHEIIGQNFIAVHVRDRFSAQAGMPDELKRFLEKFETIVRKFLEKEDLDILVASCSDRIKDYFKEKFPGKIKTLPSVSSGHSFVELSDENCEADKVETLTYEALRDMWIISDAKYFVGSAHSGYALFAAARSSTLTPANTVWIDEKEIEKAGKAMENTQIRLGVNN